MFSPFICLAIALAVSNFYGTASAAFNDPEDSFHPFSVRSVKNYKLESHYQLGDATAKQETWVSIHVESLTKSRLNKRATQSTGQVVPSPPVIDLTPAECNSKVCFPGWYAAPNQSDCDVVEAAQLYNSTGSLTALPGRIITVSSGSCAVVFQNPIKNNFTLQYNWASLGKIMQILKKKCFVQDDPSSGAACKMKHYLDYKLQNVVISVQRYLPVTPCA